MTEGQSKSAAVHRPGRTRFRRLGRLGLVAVMTGVLVSMGAGTASAAPTIVPQLDCYAMNPNGSVTVVIGYKSTFTSTRTIPHGTNNRATPSKFTASLPTVFKPGVNHGAATVTIPQSDFSSSPSWYLNGARLDYMAAANATGICTPAQLPALANGAALVVVLLLAGGVGVVMIRRSKKAVLPETAPPAA